LNLSFGSDTGEQWKLAADTDKPVLTLDKTFTRLSEFEIPADQVIAEFYTENHGAHVLQFNAQDMDAGGVGAGSGYTEMNTDDIRPGVTARIVARRCWNRYMWSVGYIMATLGVIGNAAFRLDPVDDYGDRLATFFTLLLTTISFQVVVDDKLPNMPYLSILEIYVICMNVLIIIQIFEAFVSRTWHEQFSWDDTVEGSVGDPDKDVLFAYINLGIWVCMHVIFLIYIRFYVVPCEQKRIARLTNPETLKQTNAESEKHVQEGQKCIERAEDSYKAAFQNVTLHKLANVQEKQRANSKAAGSQQSLPPNVASRNPDLNGNVKYVAVANTNENPTFTSDNTTNGDISLDGAFCIPNNGSPLCYGSPLGAVLKHSGFSVPMGGSSWLGGSENDSGMARDELEELWPQIFTKIDANGNGTLTQDEIVAATGNMYEPISKFLKDADTNMDDKVSKAEWDAMLFKVLAGYGDPSPRTADVLREFVNSGKDKVVGFGFN